MNRKLIKIGGDLLNLKKPKVMGIVNVTPDSFFAGSRLQEKEALKTRLVEMRDDGVDIIDIGGYSTRPGAAEVSVQEELDRVLPALEMTRNLCPDTPVSIDTFRAAVAREAVGKGAAIINDVSGGTLDTEMFHALRDLRVPYILMHMRGTPATMQNLANYRDVVPEIIAELQKSFSKLRALGVKDVVIDPGFGFAKTIEQNYALLQSLESFAIFEAPVLVGLSRKSFIWKTLKGRPDQTLNATSALNALALLRKADILRVHDVKEAVEIVKLLNTNCL